MQNPENELREYLKRLVYRFLFITGLKKQLSLMREWEQTNRIEALNEGSYFFRLVSFSFTRTILIELAKFISEKEKKSLIDFLKKVKDNSTTIFPTKYNPKSEMREVISAKEYRNLITEHLNMINSHKELISKIKTRRDKALAHSDSTFFNNDKLIYEKYPISLDDIDNLMETIDEILNAHHVH